MKAEAYERSHNRIVRHFAPECTLFLKTDGRFPLKAPCPVALFGSGARQTIRGGTGSGEVNSRASVSIERGLMKAGFTITSSPWLEAYAELLAAARKKWMARLRKDHPGIKGMMQAFGSIMPEPEYDLPLNYPGEAAIYVLSRISGEGSDRSCVKGDVCLTDTEVRDILALNARFDRFILVLNTGGPVDLSPVRDVGNILLLSQLGAMTGLIFADILLGRANPGGKLATTWPAAVTVDPVGDFGDPDKTHYREGIYVGYRYYDSTGIKPLWPFGFGLSYTSFSVAALETHVSGRLVSVLAKVSNTGSYAGKEVVQLYVSVPQGRLDQPYQSLAAFAKTPELAPGADCRVWLSFDMADLASYDTENEAWILEKGSYRLRLGNASDHTQVTADLILEETVTVRKAKNVLGDCGFKDWQPNIAQRAAALTLKGQAQPGPAPVSLTVPAAAFVTENVLYDREEDVDASVHDLTDEELCKLNIGAFSKGVLSFIGNASQRVAGAAGDFTRDLEKKGFPCLVTADGPAGLRLSRQYVDGKNGPETIGNDSLALFSDFLPGPARALTKLAMRRPGKGQVVHNQYCTMIPIGTALAQSFNTDGVAALGDLVGDEMERFHVDFWLAPALNIHRSILCGRNFEYYSEDPLVSGKMAAAITRGVQAHAGRAVTLKHFAANNQENNRYSSNSLVSERAMREIYLKGFGICVREARPRAVMTSYNLLNGRHTSEHKGLISDILRSEFGFEGIVMTDWIIHIAMDGGAYPPPDSVKIAAAGGDVVMPGSQQDFDNLLKGLKEGRISRSRLEKNATRMYRMAGILKNRK